MNNREWVMNVMRNGGADRVPVGFWYHYLQDELEDGFADPALIEKNIAGHKKFFEEFRPDFLKIMTDGFFLYPNKIFAEAEKASQLRELKPLGPDHPWIERQVQFAKTITSLFGKEAPGFYNIFSPATTFRFVRHNMGAKSETVLGAFIAEDRDAVQHALNVAAEDLSTLATRIIVEGGADGIYYSTQDQCGVSAADQLLIIAPADMWVLNTANNAKAGVCNILHICGYDGHHNELERYTMYPAQVINWACVFEGVPLEQGRALFGGRPVIGGFDNTAKGILFTGSEAEVKAETKRLLAAAGRRGILLGTDCTIPRGTDLKRLNWVREACRES